MSIQHPLSSKLIAEALGTALLLATVIGSGIMGAKLAGGNIALALLGNTISTGAMLVVLILIFGPISGAHFNPVVTVAFALRRAFDWAAVTPYIAAQVAGAVAGAWLAHAMFDLPVLQISTTVRTGLSLIGTTAGAMPWRRRKCSVMAVRLSPARSRSVSQASEIPL